MAIDVLSRFILDASQLPGAVPWDAPWRIIGRIGDLVLELLGSLPRPDKQISVRIDGQILATGLTKFGALIGDGSRVGANAVTSPGTLLPPGSVVPRLGLVDQLGAGGYRERM